MNNTPAPRYTPNLEDKLHQIGCALKALDILAHEAVQGHWRHDISGQALIYIVEHLEADLAAVTSGLDRYASAAPEAREANVWGIACPWTNGSAQEEGGEAAAA